MKYLYSQTESSAKPINDSRIAHFNLAFSASKLRIIRMCSWKHSFSSFVRKSISGMAKRPEYNPETFAEFSDYLASKP
jgi:hypothetical protein